MKLPSKKWHVKHSLKAIKKLSQIGARFCRAYEGKKRPVGNAWQEKKNTYAGEDKKLLKWVKKGGNYGVVGGFGDLTILDEDDERITELRKTKLPETFVVSTCHNDRHSYFTVPNFDGSIRLQDPEDPGEVVGDVQDEGKMVVGPGSIIYPKYDQKAGTGGYYEVVNDKLPAFVKQQAIEDTFGKFVNVREKRNRKTEDRGKEIDTKTNDGSIAITEVGKIKEAIKNGNLRHKKGGKHGEYYVGPHPVHGSKTGGNFHVIPSLNAWRCWRNGHNSGGGPYYWIAVEEGIIDCSQAYKDSPALQGKKFKKVLDIAVERGLISREQARIVGVISPETREETGETVKSFKI